MAGDPNFASVALLMHFDGENDAAVFTDSSSNAYAFTYVGSPTTSTDQTKFGSTSLHIPATSNVLSHFPGEDLNPGTQDFTLEFFCYWTEIPSSHVVQFATNYNTSWEGFNFNFWDFYDAGELIFDIDNSTVLSGSWLPSLNTWHHIVVERSGTDLTIMVDGDVIATTTDSTDISGGTDQSFDIGMLQDVTNVFIDEYRFTIGVARYADGYVAPTAAFPDFAAETEPAGIGRFPVSFLGAVSDGVTTTAVPLKSWQTTLQVGSSNYAQIVVPAVAEYIDAIYASTEFSVTMRLSYPDGTFYSDTELFAATVDKIDYSRSASGRSCTISGSSTGYTEEMHPDAGDDRELVGIRSISINDAGTTIRCSIDRLLRPAQRCLFDGDEIIVSKITHSASVNGMWMDVFGNAEYWIASPDVAAVSVSCLAPTAILIGTAFPSAAEIVIAGLAPTVSEA